MCVSTKDLARLSDVFPLPPYKKQLLINKCLIYLAIEKVESLPDVFAR